jgi:uncharacterized protein
MKEKAMRPAQSLILAFVLLAVFSSCKSDSRKTLSQDLVVGAVVCDLKQVESAIKRGDDVKAVDESGYSVLHIVFTMTRKYQSYATTEEDRKREAEAEQRRNEYIPKARQVIPVLLEAGADPNAKTSLGITPLMEAAETGDEEIVFMLVKAGADLKVRDKYDHDAAYYAFMAGNKELGVALRDLAAVQPTPTPTPTPTLTPTPTPSKLRDRVINEVWRPPTTTTSPSPSPP